MTPVFLPRTKLDCCVISIGNYHRRRYRQDPTAQKVALMIQKPGYWVVILNRGYRSHLGRKDRGGIRRQEDLYDRL